MIQERARVPAEESTGIGRGGARHVGRAEYANAGARGDRLVRAGATQLPPLSAARSTITVPGCRAAIVCSSISRGPAFRDLSARHDELHRREMLGERPPKPRQLIGRLLGA